MFLADTSVWVDYFHGVESALTDRLDRALAGDEAVCICGLIMTEILQGIRGDGQFRRLRRLLQELLYLPMSVEAYVLAAEICRAARQRGRTIRKTVDCLIAACAIRNRVPLLTPDKDFGIIAEVSRLRIAAPQPPGRCS